MKNHISSDEKSLNYFYADKIEGSLSAGMIQNYAFQSEGLRKRIKLNQNELKKLLVLMDEKVKEIVKAKNDVKIIENFELKKNERIKREIAQKEQKELEDIYQMREKWEK